MCGSIYRIEFPNGRKEYVYPFCKIFDTTTTLIENTRYKDRRGIYMDVFPLDGIGDTYEEAIQNYRAIDRKRKLLLTRVCALRKGRKWYKNLAIVASRCVPECVWNRQRMLREIEAMSKTRDYASCAYVGTFLGNWHEKEVMRREWFGEPTLYRFENLLVYGPENYDAYLTRMYGDWRTLPPVEKRVSHHDYVLIDINKSYLQG